MQSAAQTLVRSPTQSSGQPSIEPPSSPAHVKQKDTLFKSVLFPKKLALFESATPFIASPEPKIQLSADSGPLEAEEPAEDCTLLSLPEQSPTQFQPALPLPEDSVPAGYVLSLPEVSTPAGSDSSLPEVSPPAGSDPSPLEGPRGPLSSPSPLEGPLQLFPLSTEGPEEPLQPSVIAEGPEEQLQPSIIAEGPAEPLQPSVIAEEPEEPL